MFFESSSYELVGFLIARGIGIIYLIAFLIFYRQYIPLVGENGIEPIDKQTSSFRYFSIFYYFNNDAVIKFSALTGILLSSIVFSGINEFLGQLGTMFIFFILWVLIVSFLNSGGIFTGQRWEAILAETGFIAIFLSTLPHRTSEIVILLFRWILFRLILGAALVKIKGRGDWRSLEALKNHFESQPFPGPLSWILHNLPNRVLEILTLLIPLSMLTLPFLYFTPQPYASIAGVATITLQILIFLGGNYGWLNLITVVLSLSLFNDEILLSLFSLSIKFVPNDSAPNMLFIPLFITLLLSINPLIALISRKNYLNVSYNPFHIANSYRPFPKVYEDHFELVIEAKIDEQWKELELHSAFTEPNERPSQIAPYHYMLEYIIYLYVHGSIEKDKWLERLLRGILEGDKQIKILFHKKPFSEGLPDKVRAVRYKYEFTSAEEKSRTGNYWHRERQEVIKEMPR